MNQLFLTEMLEHTGFPQEAKVFFQKCSEDLKQRQLENRLDEIVAFFHSTGYDIKATEDKIKAFGEEANLSPYTLWMLVLIEAAIPVKEAFAQHGDPEELFWETFTDLRCKALECKEVYGIWGTFVAFWYPIFYKLDLVKLGRLEYENYRYDRDEPYVFGDIEIKKGDIVKNIHIPSSGEPFDEAARLDSYKKAYNYFRKDFPGKPLICVCDSWLLFSENTKILPETSNIVSFRKDFHMLSEKPEDTFHDIWRVFGGESDKPYDQLPEKTSLQKAFKKHLLAGGKTGEAFGVLLFDGEKILNNKG